MHLPMQETWVPSLGQEDPLELEMATHSRMLAWRIQGHRCLAGYSPWDYKESDMTACAHSMGVGGQWVERNTSTPSCSEPEILILCSL